tara:strand:+ start:719 stop:1267 length:549 start_codon:yes stop_codon:yes gene_type:complete
MKKCILVLFFILITNHASATIKENIMSNLRGINNISFKFEQNINGKIESGKCKIQYPKKIYCNYDLSNEKILISNGKSLVIKTKTSYYLYPLEKTPLNLILDKDFLLDKINILKERIIDDKFINFTFIENNSEVNVFFNKSNFDLVGWQTLDIYQNLSITYLSSVIKNQNIDEKIFILPKQN